MVDLLERRKKKHELSGHDVLLPVYPNPASEAVYCVVDRQQPGRLRLVVHDLIGREVAVVADELAPPGRTTYRWDGRDAAGNRLPAGVYLIRMDSGARSAAAPVVLLH